MLPELNPDWVQYILMNMEDAVFLVRMDGGLLYANPAAKRLFGLEVRSGVKIWDAIPFVEGNDSLIQLFIDGVMKESHSLHSLVEYVNNEGALFNLHVTLTCESEESGKILVVIHDLTDLTKVHSAFARYTSPEIANYVLTAPGGEKQGGQNREVSILMSDLRGFTAMSVHLSCDQLIDVLNHYFESMAAVIQRFGGTVIEFLGDGIFVVFGAPQDLPDHAAAAVSCAVEMQNAMASVNAWNRERGYPEMEMGIAINSGPVIVGNIGSDKKMKYGCMGETVNLAGRMESFCLGGQIYISDNTRRMISGELKIIGEHSFIPKGSGEEMRIFRIGGIGKDCVLSSSGEEVCWRTFSGTVPVSLSVLDGKTVGTERHAGALAAVSEDGRFGILTTEYRLQAMQDLVLQIGGMDVYVKVTDQEKNGYRIGFTMKPEGFSEFIDRELIRKNDS